MKQYSKQVYSIAFIIVTLPLPMLLNNLAVFLFCITSLMVYLKKRTYTKWHLIEKLFMLLYVISLISLVYTCDVYGGYKVLEKYSVFLLFPIFFSTITFKENDINFLKKTLINTAVLYLLFCLCMAAIRSIQYGSIYIFNPSNLVLENQFRYHSLVGFFDNTAITFGIVLSLALSFLIEDVVLLKGKITKLKVIKFLVLIIGCFLMGSFAVLLCISLIVFSLFFFIKINRKYYVILLVPIIAAVFVFYNKAEGLDSKIFKYDFKHNVHNKNWNSLNIRLAKWECAFDVIEDNLLLGVGVGCAQKKLKEAYKKNDFKVALEKNYSSHNQYLYYIIESGLAGITTFVLLILSGFFYAIKHKSFCLLSVFILITFCGLTDDILIVNKGIIFFTFFILLLLPRNSTSYEKT